MRQAMGFCALALLLASVAFAGDGRKSLLTPPEGVVSDARGTVEIEDDALEIKVVNLMPDAAYSVWLDDGSAVLAEIGSLMTDEAGKGKIEFKSDADPEDAREAPLPFGVENADQLAGRAMEIRDSEAAVVLEGMTPDLQFTEDEGLSGRFLVQQPDPPIDEDARGWILLVEEDLHQMIKVLLHKLAPETVYSISLSSPGGDAELLGMVTTNPGGVGQLRVDNLKLDAIPFGVSSLTELEGYGVAVADPEENVVLTGIIGALTPGDGDDDDGDDDDGDDEDDDDDCDEPEIESESCLEA
ncbi:MAG: hypothetical protein JXA90_07750, partial [Planctomycetes bacterium]|nr:hypothetical protein [Planctomycetota bacterium]